MNETLSLAFSYAPLIFATLIFITIIIVGIGVCSSFPKLFMLLILFIMLVSPSANSYGTEDGKILAMSILWVKGSKSFFFSFFQMMLVSVWLFGAIIANKWDKKSEGYYNPLSKWYLGYSLLFTGYLIFATFGTKSLLYEFAGTGVINIIYQGMFVAILFATVKSERDVILMFKFVLICLAFNESWGVFRYIFLGGDPQNIYANLGTSKVKVTFTDINDSIFACFIFGVCAWKTLAEKEVIKWERLMYILLGGMALLIPALSARRSVQIGLLFSIILLYILLPKGRRNLILIALAITIPIVLTSLATRMNDPSKSTLENILIDVQIGGKAVDPRKSRFYELETAWETVKKSPFFGVGPSGEFEVESAVGLEYHNGSYAFVHSGLGHILLKTGFVGLFIFLGIYSTYIINVFKGYRFILPRHKAFVVGGLCGFVALLPTIQNGTPVIEIRTMLIAGFLFAIPLICIAIGRKSGLESRVVE